MQEINELSVTPHHLILLLMFRKYKEVKSFTHRNGRFGDLRTEHLSGGRDTPLLRHCRNGPGLDKQDGWKTCRIIIYKVDV